MKHTYFKIVSLITVCFFTWTFGGLASLANAAKAVHDMEQRKARYERNSVSTEQRFERAADDIEKILHDKKLSRKQRRAALKARKKEIDSLDDDIRKSFAKTEAHLKKAKLSPKIMKRHHDFVKQYEEYLEVVRHDLDSLENKSGFLRALGKKFDKHRIDSIREKIKKRKTRNKKKIKKFDPNNLPFRSRQLKHRVPRLKKEEFQRDLDKNQAATHEENKLTTAALDAALDLMVPNAEAVPLPPAPEDLSETIEVQFTPDILAKAAELEHNPVKIYNWVRNNIEFVPTWGSIQGAQYCLETMQGNAFDTASLLIALLRASNIPARYVMGTVEIPIDKVMNWVGGFTDPQAALDFIASGGIPVKALLENPNGGIDPDQAGAIGGTTVEPDISQYQIKYAQMEHVWVEALIDYIPSRGSRHTQNGGDTWIELDASFKQYEYSDGLDIKALMPFSADDFYEEISANATRNDEEGYISGLNYTAAQNRYDEYIAELDEYIVQNMPNATIGDVLGGKRKIDYNAEYLLGTLPYKRAVLGTINSEIPDTLRHKITLKLLKDDFDSEPLYVEKSLPEIAGGKITIGYKAASSEDAAVLESFIPNTSQSGVPISLDQLPQELPAYALQVVPELRINDEVIATGLPVGLGSEEIFTIQFYDPSLSIAPIANSIVAGEYLAVGVNVSKPSKKRLDNKISELETIKASIETLQFDRLNREKYFGDLLFGTTLAYHAEVEKTRILVAEVMDVVHLTLPSETIFGIKLDVDYLWGIPRTIRTSGLFMDADHLCSLSKHKDGAKDNTKKFMITTGMVSSQLEHSIPETMYSTQDNAVEGISAVKALNLAAMQGDRIYTIGKSNSYVLDTLQVENDVKIEIKNAIESGKTVTVSSSNISYNGWTGCGYIIIDPETGAGAYMLSGGLSGGLLLVIGLLIFCVLLALLPVIGAIALGGLGLVIGAAVGGLMIYTAFFSSQEFRDLLFKIVGWGLLGMAAVLAVGAWLVGASVFTASMGVALVLIKIYMKIVSELGAIQEYMNSYKDRYFAKGIAYTSGMGCV